MRIGKGGDKDELNTVYIYDSHMFPFHRAEQYHQFYKVPPCPLHVSLALALFFPFFLSSFLMLAGRDSCGRGPRMSKRRKRASDASHPLAARSRDSPFLSRPQPPAPQHPPLCGDSPKTGAGMAIWHTLRRVCHFESSVLGLTFLRRESGLCAPRLPTVLYPRSTGSNGTLLFEEQSASSTEKQRRVNSC